MILQVGVKALLKNSKGEYLFIKRNPHAYAGVSAKWDLPGGRIEPGSSLMENLTREIKEETSLYLKKEPCLIAAQDILRKTFHVVRLTYRGEIEGKVVLSSEHTNFLWVTFEELKNLEPLDS